MNSTLRPIGEQTETNRTVRTRSMPIINQGECHTDVQMIGLHELCNALYSDYRQYFCAHYEKIMYGDKKNGFL